MDPARHRA